MKLSVGDRIKLLGLLPKTGNVREMRDTEVLKNKIYVSEELFKLIGGQVHEGQIVWNEALDLDYTEIDLKDNELQIIKSQLEKLDSNKALPMSLLKMWDKFVGE